jgi:hypothetical protein
MTKRNPWVFIYFEGVDTHMNLVENLDRVIIDRLDERFALQQDFTEYEEFTAAVPPDFSRPLNPEKVSHSSSVWLAEWKAEVDKRLLRQQFVFLVGAPGIGKTHYIALKKEDWLKRGEICKEHDGSSDEFFKQALADVLDEHLDELVEAKVWYLIMDEFHMMPVDLKRQLLQWVRSHPSVKLLMIGNRYDSVDIQLFTDIFDVLDPSNHLVCVRNDLQTFLAVKRAEIGSNGNFALFISIWLRVTRNLFGEELLSFRLFLPIKESFHHYDGGLVDKAAEILSGILRQKVPHNSREFAINIVGVILEAYKRAKYPNDATAPQLSEIWEDAFKRVFKNPIQIPSLGQDSATIRPTTLLVSAALCDRDGSSSSFPEFCHPERGYIPSFSHPTHKLLSWISYMYGRENHTFPMALGVKVFGRQGIIDFPLRFPVFPTGMEVITSAHNESSWRIACARVDISNLEAVIQVVIRGYMIRQSEAERKWKKESITDVEKFSKLVSLYPNFVSLTSDDNLHALLKLGDINFVANVLAQTRAKADVNDPSSPHFVAAWKLYSQLLPNDSSKITIKASTLAYPHLKAVIEFDLKNLLLWASTYAFASMEVVGDVAAFEEMLWGHLLYVSTLCERENKQMEDKKGVKNLLRLWCFLFAPLIQSLGGQNGMPYSQALTLASERYPPVTNWPKELKVFSKLLHDRATLVDLETIISCVDVLEENSALG